MSQPVPDPSYSAKDITVLEGLEPVRLRPGMYIGSTGSRGLHHLVYEVVDNAVDEAMAGFNDSIEVTIHPDNSVTVVDQRSRHPGRRRRGDGPAGADGRPDEAPRRRQVRRRGLQGLGRPPRRRRVGRERALGVARSPTVERDGKVYRQEFARGVPQGEMKTVGISQETGTTISFLPDSEIFEETRVLPRHAAAAPARDGVPDARPADQARSTSARGSGARSSTSRAGSRTSSSTSTRARTRSTARSSTSRPRTRRAAAASRSRCSGTRSTSSRSSRSPTTSTPTRAALTCRASPRRSRGR